MANATTTKSTKAETSYQDRPKGEERCDGCTMFVAPGSCTAVEGKIVPQGWCDLYEPKGKAE